MVKWVIFGVVCIVFGYYLGNKAWRDKVNSWVRKQASDASSRISKGK